MKTIRDWLWNDEHALLLAGGCFFMAAMGYTFGFQTGVFQVYVNVLLFIAALFLFALSFRSVVPEAQKKQKPFSWKKCVLGCSIICVSTVLAFAFRQSANWVVLMVAWFFCMVGTGIGAMITVSALREAHLFQRRRRE